MEITDEMMDHISALTKLYIPIEERETTKKELSNMISYMTILDEWDTADMEGRNHTVPVKNVFREDVVKTSVPLEEILQNAPNQKNGYFQVPKTVE